MTIICNSLSLDMYLVNKVTYQIMWYVCYNAMIIYLGMTEFECVNKQETDIINAFPPN